MSDRRELVATQDELVEMLRRAERAEAVVVTQREALLGVASRATPGPGSSYLVPDKAIKRVRAALDAEEVSEPGPSRPTLGARTDAGVEVGDGESPGSLTSPVDTAPGAKP